MTIACAMPLLCFSTFKPISDSDASNRKQTNRAKVDPSMAPAQREEINQGLPTIFRRWTIEGSNVHNEPIPGLRDMLTNAGLSCFCISVEAWCRKTGAAFLSEVIEEVESLCAFLGPPGAEGLAPELRKRLLKALSSTETSAEKRDGVEAQETIEHVVANIRNQISATRSCPPLSQSDRIFLMQCNSDQDVFVTGLRNAFQHVGLSRLVGTAEAWCRDNGAAFMEEILESFDDLCTNLTAPGFESLDPRLQERLKEALSSRVASGKQNIENAIVGGSAKPMTQIRAKTW